MVIFRFFQDCGCLPSWIFKFGKSTANEFWRSQMHHTVKFHQNQSSGCENIMIFPVFQDGGRPPSWICFPCYWTTHDAYLVVFTAMQNLVAIHDVVSMTWMSEYFACLDRKCLFTRSTQWGLQTLKPPFPLAHVDIQYTHPLTDYTHHSKQQAQSIHALPHNYAIKSPIGYNGTLQIHPPPNPLPLRRSLLPSNTPITRLIILTIPNNIRIHSAVLPQYTFRTDL